MYPRYLNLDDDLRERSLFLFGARQTGKSTLLRATYPNARFVDLLAADEFRQLSVAPEQLRQSLQASDRLIVIDEIQKLPSLLDEVHLMIERDRELRFILTGSSARKLKRGGANLLGGRARTRALFPLTSQEAGISQVGRMLSIGAIPSILDSADPRRDLKEYVGVYLQEEIRAESLARSIEAFARFLNIAGLANGKQLNFTKIGSDAQVPPRTVREFFSVLVDTLLGYELRPFQRTKSRKAVSTSKFFFFDIGVAHALQDVWEISPRTSIYGEALEHLIANELRAYLSYTIKDSPLTFWRSLSQLEVDFVVGDELAIEVKGTGRVQDSDLRGLRAFSEEIALRRKIVVSCEQQARILDDGIEVMPIPTFLESLWSGELI